MNVKYERSKYSNLVFSFSLFRNLKFLISIFLVGFIFISLHTIEIIKIENPSPKFMERYEQNKRDRPEEYQWNPLQVGNHWQYTAYTGYFFNTVISQDSTFNDTTYFKKLFHNGNFEYERNTDNSTYCRDLYDYDEDPLTTELLWDSLGAEAPYAYYSYHNPDGTSSLWETIVMEKYIAYLPLFEDSVMIANLVRYGGTVGIEEYWAEGYGLIMVIMGGGHSALTAANIDGVQYGNFVDVEEITIQQPAPILNLSNYPNPFNPTTTIDFNVTQTSSFATIEIYNLKGQKVKTIPIYSSTHQPINSVTWNGTDQNNKPVSSGIYFARLRLRPDSSGKAGNVEANCKMLLLK